MLQSWLLSGLLVYTKVTSNDAVKTWLELMDSLGAGDAKRVFQTYHRFYERVMKYGWPDLLIELILNDDNVFSRTAAAQGADKLSPSLKKVVERDLNILQEVASLGVDNIKERCISLFKETEGTEDLSLNQAWEPAYWPGLKEMTGLGGVEPSPAGLSCAARWLFDARQRIKEQLLKNPWGSCVEILASYYAETGFGLFNHCAAAYWKGSSVDESGLIGLANPDPIRIKQLIGLDDAKNIVTGNTEHFLAGLPANNVLLYGSRGTGKSSMVKALSHSYVRRKLRLIEIAKSDLPDIPRIYRMLAEEPFKFILFIDDLSFDDMEREYKTLKTMLEGGIAARPANVLIYATSNRRHLIKETFAERQEDIHSRDGSEEKLSLADRFGITVTFPSPDQAAYLKIVEALAIEHQLKIDSQELRQMATRWEMWHNGRSGRTARQFIDHLICEYARNGLS